MIGRADIEGSKSNVAMNAWLPQASYPCVGFPLSVPVLSWLFDARGRPPKEPFPVRPPAGTRRPAPSPRKQLEQSADSRRVRGLGPPVPALRANPFPEVTDPILPTSLPTLFHRPEAVQPWRPDAVMSTTGRGRHSVLRIFKGRRGRTGHRATCGALPAAGPYLRLSLPFTWNLSPLLPSKFSFEYLLLPPRSAPTAAPPRLTPKVSAQFGTVTRLPVHPASPVLLTKNGPLGALDSVARLNEAAAPSYLFKNSHPGSSYPEGNFGGNQLLDGSISLSPLYPSQTNDLHVSIAAGLHQSFLWLRPAQA
ncbi:hypothetical protein L1887_51363 [Cichorium endivia]|nr:hypothetical protein L1887_51363 [Cichorium endivia]